MRRITHNKLGFVKVKEGNKMNRMSARFVAKKSWYECNMGI